MSRSRPPNLITLLQAADRRACDDARDVEAGEAREAEAATPSEKAHAARLDEIRRSIRAGRYEVDVDALADKLLLHGIVEHPPSEVSAGPQRSLHWVALDDDVD